MRWFVFFGLLAVLAFSASAVNIGNCTTLDNSSASPYVLTANVSLFTNATGLGGNSACMNVTANNVTLDCNGFTLMGNFTGETHAINVSNTTINTTIKNCKIMNFSRAFAIVNANNTVIDNNTFYNNTGAIEWLFNLAGHPGSWNVTIKNNVFLLNGNSSVTNGAADVFLSNVDSPLLNVSYNNFTLSNGSGIWSVGNATIMRNRFVNVSGPAVYIQNGSWSNITYNVFLNSSLKGNLGVTNSSQANIYLSSAPSSNVSYNNMSIGINGIFISINSANNHSNNSFVSYNNISFMNTSAIYMTVAGGVNVSNNTIYNITSANAGYSSTGINISTANSSSLWYNSISNVSSAAIYLTSAANSTILLNVISDVSRVNLISGQLASVGIFIASSPSSNVTFNNVSTGLNGILLSNSGLIGTNNSFIAFNRLSYLNSSGVYVLNSQGVNVSNNTIFNISSSNVSEAGYGVYISGSPSVNVSANGIVNVSGAGVYLTTSSNSLVYNNTIANVSRAHILIGSNVFSSSGIIVTSSQSTNVSFNNVSSALSGIHVGNVGSGTGSNFSFVGFNRLSFMNDTGIRLRSSIGVNMSNNTVFNITNDSGAPAYGISISGGNYSNSSNNDIRNISASGISVMTSSNSTVQSNVISNIGSAAIGFARHVPAGIFAGSVSELLSIMYNTVSFASSGIYVARGGGATTGANNSNVSFNTISFTNLTGITLVGAVGSNVSNNTIWNVSNSSAGTQATGISLTDGNNTNLFYNVISNVTSNSPSAGIMSTISDPSIPHQNVTIQSNYLSSSSLGLNLSYLNSGLVIYLNTLTSHTLAGMGFGQVITTNVTENYLTSATDKIMNLTANSSVVFTNMSINQSALVLNESNSNFTNKFYLTFYARDSNGMLSGVPVTLLNSSGIALASGISDSSGLAIRNLLVQEYLGNGTHVWANNGTDAKPFVVTASVGGYQAFSASVNFTESSTYTVSLTPNSGGPNTPNPTPTPTAVPSDVPTTPTTTGGGGYNLPPRSTPVPTPTPSEEVVEESTPTPTPVSSGVGSVELSRQYSLVLSEVEQRISSAQSAGKDVSEAKRLLALAKEAALKRDYTTALGYLNNANALLVTSSGPAPVTSTSFPPLAAVIVLLLLGAVGYYYFTKKR